MLLDTNKLTIVAEVTVAADIVADKQTKESVYADTIEAAEITALVAFNVETEASPVTETAANVG